MRFRNFLLTTLFCMTGMSAIAQCSDHTVLIRGNFGTARFFVEVADSSAERARGLMHRESLPSGAGMLFIYGWPRHVAFWMRNTLIPLDMIFLGRDGRIRHIHENAIPLDETPIPGGDDILAVLEINGGLSRQLGLDVGDELQHPGLPQKFAAWPCEKP